NLEDDPNKKFVIPATQTSWRIETLDGHSIGPKGEMVEPLDIVVEPKENNHDWIWIPKDVDEDVYQLSTYAPEGRRVLKRKIWIRKVNPSELHPTSTKPGSE